MVEYLRSKHKALRSTPSAAKKINNIKGHIFVLGGKKKGRERKKQRK
jgi:hypothetical protein